MSFNFFLCKLFFLIFMLFFCNNFSFSLSVKNNSFMHFKRDSKNKLFFLNKNECFSFAKFNKNFSIKKNKITILNRKFFGLFQENRFQIFHIVKLNETLYSIAKHSGHNYYELSKFNSIKKPYRITVGQKIWVGDFFIKENENNCFIVDSSKNNSTSCRFIFDSSLHAYNFLKKNTQYDIKKICFFCDKKLEKNNTTIFKKKNFVLEKDWNWPIKSKNIQYVYHSQSKNKEIEFFGYKGQPVFAAATGKVVFVTDFFRKYGRLIIIKHSKNYLSIYAFNNFILVKPKDQVYMNQQIATMGSSEKNSPKLYFEVRYRGQSINPLNLLPKIQIKKVNN